MTTTNPGKNCFLLLMFHTFFVVTLANKLLGTILKACAAVKQHHNESAKATLDSSKLVKHKNGGLHCTSCERSMDSKIKCGGSQRTYFLTRLM